MLEPGVVGALSPSVPLTALPWALRDHGLRPGPLTAFVGELAVDCLGGPLVEEGVKLLVVLRSGALPPPGSALARHTSVHNYLGYLLAAGMGLKMADNMRRVCLYTRPENHQKTFFAFARGVFPVHEICAALVNPPPPPLALWTRVLPCCRR